MKLAKRLQQALRDTANNAKKVSRVEWLKTQPGSTKRGVRRGNFKLPAYVI